MMDEALYQRIAALRLQNQNTYRERNQLVALACRLSLALGLKAGVKKNADPLKGPFSTVAYFELPTGQCGFHIPDWDLDLFEGLPEYNEAYDGHSTETKNERINNPGLPKTRSETTEWWGLEFPEPYNKLEATIKQYTGPQCYDCWEAFSSATCLKECNVKYKLDEGSEK